MKGFCTVGKNKDDIKQSPETFGEDEKVKVEEHTDKKPLGESEKDGAQKGERKEKLLSKELERKEKELEELKNQLDEKDDKYMRLFAEYDNFRKRAQKEKDAAYSDGVCDSVEKLLAVLDNLERAASLDENSTDVKSVLDGVVKTLEQAKEVFSKLGVEEIAAQGEKFNPELHNAVMHEENPDYGENTVSDVFMKGYKRGDKVIRHSVVKVMN